MSKVYFTIDQANHTLPMLQEEFTRLHTMHVHVVESMRRLRTQGYKPKRKDFAALPENVGPKISHDLTNLKVLLREINFTVFRLNELGCMVRDIEAGIVSWYARRDGRDVLLCWQLGESEVSYWREINTDFIGRMPIPDDGFSREEEKLRYLQ